VIQRHSGYAPLRESHTIFGALAVRPAICSGGAFHDERRSESVPNLARRVIRSAISTDKFLKALTDRLMRQSAQRRTGW